MNTEIDIEKRNKHNSQPYILLKIFNNKGRLVNKIGSHKSKRIFCFFEAGNFQDSVFEVSIRYSNGVNNEGVYESKKELYSALRAFLEK